MAGVDLTSPETVARAVLNREHKRTGAAPLTAEQAAMNSRAAEIREEAKEKGPRSSIESMNTPSMPDKTAVDGFMREAFYSSKDINGKTKVEKDSKTRMDSTEAVRKVAEKFLDPTVEYKNLTDPEKNIARDAARQVLLDWPEAKAIFDSIKPATRIPDEINKTLDELFSRPDFKPIARRLFAGVIKPEELHHIKTDLLAKTERAKKTREYREQSLKNKNGEYDSYNKIIEGFKDPTKAGTDAERLENLKKGEAKNRADKQTKEDDIRRKIEEIRRQERLAANPTLAAAAFGRISTLESDISTLQSDISKIDGELNQITALEAKKQAAEENIRRVQEEQIKIKEDLDEADYQYHLARAEQEADNVQHIRSEEAVLDRFRGVFREGMRELLTKDIEKAEAAQAKRIEKADEDAKKATTTEEKNILASVNTRWDRDISNRIALRRWWNPNNREFNRQQINRDYTRLMSEGADAVVANMMLENGVAPDLLAAQAWLTANKDAADRMKAQVTETLLTRRIQTGSITEGDARFIAGSTWGKEAINKAIKNKDDIKRTIEGLEKRGIIKGSMGEGFYDLIRSNPVFWLSLIFGSAAFAAIGPAVVGAGLLTTASFAGAGGGAMTGGLINAKRNLS